MPDPDASHRASSPPKLPAWISEPEDSVSPSSSDSSSPDVPEIQLHVRGRRTKRPVASFDHQRALRLLTEQDAAQQPDGTAPDDQERDLEGHPVAGPASLRSKSARVARSTSSSVARRTVTLPPSPATWV